MRDSSRDDHYMRMALALAKFAAEQGEVPVGAVVVAADGRVIGRGSNRREMDHDPTAHAEMLALRQAAAEYGDWRLFGCSLYVTVEPCVMCAGAAAQSQIEWVVYGAQSPKGGAFGSRCDLREVKGLSHVPRVVAGVLEDECVIIMQGFFRERRSMTSNQSGD